MMAHTDIRSVVPRPSIQLCSKCLCTTEFREHVSRTVLDKLDLHRLSDPNVIGVVTAKGGDHARSFLDEDRNDDIGDLVTEGRDGSAAYDRKTLDRALARAFNPLVPFVP